MKEKFQKFLSEKGIKPEDFTNLEASKQAELFVEYNEANEKALAQAIEEKASKEQIDELKSEISATMAEKAKALNETLKEYGLAIKKMSQKSNRPSRAKDLKSLIAEQSDEVKQKFDAWQKGEQVSLKIKGASFLSVKAAANMTIADNVTGEVPAAQYVPGLDTLPSRRVRLLNLLNRQSATSNLIRWVSQANRDGSAGQTAEGAVKNKIDFDLVASQESTKKTTAFIKVSDEMLNDIDFIEGEIRSELLRELIKAVETQVYSGDGTGQNLNGIRTVASAFAAGAFADFVDNPNPVDVLRVAINQIELAEQDRPTAILMNPSDLTKLLMDKVTATDKRYVDALVEVASNRSLDGVPIITTTLVAVDDYLVGHFPFATLYEKGGVDLEMGYDSDDFTRNLRTIRAEWQGAAVVRTNRRSAFVKGDFSTDQAAIEKPAA